MEELSILALDSLLLPTCPNLQKQLLIPHRLLKLLHRIYVKMLCKLQR